MWIDCNDKKPEFIFKYNNYGSSVNVLWLKL